MDHITWAGLALLVLQWAGKQLGDELELRRELKRKAAGLPIDTRTIRG